LPIGANFAVLKRAIEALGGFDSRVGFDNSRKNSMIAGEDSLLGIKVRDAGLSIYYQPRASVFHHISAHKLTRSYFLKRHYWEGATQVVIKSCKQQIDHHMWIKILFWHLSKMLKVFIKIIIGLLKGDPSTTRMLQLSKLAYSFGVSVQTLKIGRSKVKCG
jgi:GT2 family glycosyltransferase